MNLFRAECSSKARLDGKTAVITGGNVGIGKYTAQDFYVRGGRVILACRNLDKANQAVADINQACKELENLGTLLIAKLDLASLKSVRDCAARLLKNEKRIDLLINNAGVMMCPKSLTKDGFEMQIGTNHLGHFLFTMLLLPRICQSTPARIVNVSSLAHYGYGGRIDLADLNWENKRYFSLISYIQSKLANILFTKELDRKLKENGISGVNTYCLHPGCVNTDLINNLEASFCIMDWFFRYVVRKFLLTPQQGAQTTIYCAVDEKCANESGLYYTSCSVATPSSAALNKEDARGLWDLSWKLVGLDKNYNPFVDPSK
ncbi:retinol dehydrogenase 11-like [Anoplophora glabripennis]|uniref:retinol dehydrogenase 11-like n=1 Tax=Anoplophora glabripennis TaxID=217634 RepID=UPI000C7891A9|nr:retinol dehydrogenase 11-like [Anoplophora glabripennis]